MKTKSYLKSQRKKSFASLVLAFLLMFTFNSSPIIMLSDSLRNRANAYKSTETQTYYSKNDSTEETKFSAIYPSSYKDYFTDSSENFNLLSYYTTQYDLVYKELVNKFYSYYFVSVLDTTKQAQYIKFINNFMGKDYVSTSSSEISISELFTNIKGTSFADTLDKYEFMYFAETLAYQGFTYYNETDKTDLTIDPIVAGTYSGDNVKYKKLSEFYRLLANYSCGEDTAKDDDDSSNNSINNLEAFYNSNTHYLRLKKHIDETIAKKTPLYVFDGETNNTYIASIFANMTPTTIKYNYVSDSYDTYTTTTYSFETKTITTSSGDTEIHKTIYYFGSKTQFDLGLVDTSGAQTDKGKYYVWNNNAENATAKEAVDLLYYVPVEEIKSNGDSNPDYVNNEYGRTYYRYNTSSSTTYPFVSTNNTPIVYVLNDDPTQSELDTYSSIFFNAIKSSDLNNTDNFYFQIPYEEDQLYFKKVYNSLLYVSTQNLPADLSFTKFVSLFTKTLGGKTVSTLYLKYSTTNKNIVYVNNDELSAFKSANPDYSYNLVGVDMSTADANDYVEITTSNGSDYLKGVTGEYKLYFKKTIDYYVSSTTNHYGDYETTFEPIKNLETHEVPSSAYITNDADNNRKLYILTEDGSVPGDLSSFSLTPVKQSDLDENHYYFVKVPTSLYPSGVDASAYTLYYKHSLTTVNKIYVVDDSDNAANNEVYKKYNFVVMTSDDLKNNYSSFIALAEDDAHYDKNFKLYYRYNREIDNSKLYFEDTEGLLSGSEGFTASIYKNNIIGSDKQAQSEYVELDRITYANKYANVNLLNIIPTALASNYKLFYKYKSIFVQNEITGENAIYVSYSGSTIGNGDREKFTKNLWTPVKKTDIEANPDLYVALDKTIDPNYSDNDDYTLYYKYIQSDEETKVVYDINDIDTTKSDFDKNAYELVTSSDTDYYVAGKELYFKKLLTETVETYKYDTPTYYYYQTSSTVSLSANSYYVISFYVQTHGNPEDGNDVQASFVMKDTSNAISNIALNNISTGGKWQQYFIFVSTNATTSSNVNFYLYLGDEEHGIKGTTSASEITGSVFFDEIKITKIGVSDFNKYAINDKKVYSTALTTGEGDEKTNVEGCYADEYNNQIFITNLEALKETNPRFTGNTFDNIKYIDNTITSDKGWNNMFDFDKASNDLKTLLGYSPKDEAEANNVKQNTLISTLGSKDANGKYTIKGKDMYTSSFDSFLWRYYISRDVEGTYAIDNYRTAYADGKLDVTITDDIEETKDDDDKDETSDDDNKDDDKDYIYSSSPFADNNYALKLTNKHKNISLGITSNAFTIKQYQYYKVTLWIYSPDKDGTATISINSVMQTEKGQVNGTLVSATLSSINANIENSSSENAEFGWIPVTFYIEGNNLEDMNCYLVLQADKDSTVYFDNIHIEKTTSSKYDTAASSTSDKYSTALSLITTASNDSTSLKNGNFINVTVSDTEQNVNSETPYIADNWTKISTSSSRVTAGVVSMYSNNAFFTKYYNHKDKLAEKIIDVEGFDPSGAINKDNKTNIYAIYAPSTVSSLHGTDDITNYKHTYSIYSNSMSLSASSVYKISFKVYVGDGFNGNIISNLYLSSVKDENIISSFSINGLTKDKWQTVTYYVATNTSSATVYLEIGIGDANGICFFKNADYEKLSSTMDAVLADVAKENDIASDDKTLIEKLANVKFLDMTSMSFGYRSDEINSDTNMFDQKVLTENAENSTTSTVGTNGVLVASYFDTTYTTTYSVKIDETTYYIGEVYTATISGTTYYIHKTYDAKKNAFNYALCSDSDLENEITKIGEDEVTITATADKVTLKVGSGEPIETTVTYRLYRFADLREEVKAIDDSTVSVPSLDKVIVGVGSSAETNTTSSSQNASYTYHFGTDTKDFELNNTIIPASELKNNQSANVLILANNYNTDYISLEQSSTRTIGTSTQYVLRIYVKTSDFDSDDYGLNIKVDAVNVEWTNINTTNSKNKDDKGFVCYEILIQSNSSDSITEFGVELSLGTKDNTGVGYAIISKVSLDTVSSADEFAHYSELVGDDNENIKKAIYTNKETETDDDDEEDVTDDENSVSWATFFYIFSSLLLVVTMAVAMVALVLKKHPIKLSQKYENDHDRDITTTSGRKTRKKAIKNEVTIGEDRKFNKDNSGGIE